MKTFKVIKLFVALLVTIIFVSYAKNAYCQDNRDNKPKKQESRVLTADQISKIKSILSQYNPKTLTADDAKAIHEKFREAGIHAGPETKDAIMAAGFDPEKLRQLAPPPQGEKNRVGNQKKNGSVKDKNKDGRQDDNKKFSINQTLSDEAQMNTIAFDALAFMTGNLGSQTFLPPGKVADYSGFQYLRDNDPTGMGHNTSFVTTIAFNILNILTPDQINILIDRAQKQNEIIKEFANKRYPLVLAFRRYIDGDLPSGKASLNKKNVVSYTAELYKIDGQISYDRAQLFGVLLNSLSSSQKARVDALKALNGVGNWDCKIHNPLEKYHLSRDINVAVMTYASEMYAWYAGSITADVYFCPERQGTYFGSFYLKDWPAMGNKNYSIDEQLTANAGKKFLDILSKEQRSKIENIIDLQKLPLSEIVAKREAISVELRKFLSKQKTDKTIILNLSAKYGELDGEISYYYAKVFTEVYKSLTASQKQKIVALTTDLGYIHPKGGFLYSQPIPMPTIVNTDFMFE